MFKKEMFEQDIKVFFLAFELATLLSLIAISINMIINLFELLI